MFESIVSSWFLGPIHSGPLVRENIMAAGVCGRGRLFPPRTALPDGTKHAALTGACRGFPISITLVILFLIKSLTV